MRPKFVPSSLKRGGVRDPKMAENDNCGKYPIKGGVQLSYPPTPHPHPLDLPLLNFADFMEVPLMKPAYTANHIPLLLSRVKTANNHLMAENELRK